MDKIEFSPPKIYPEIIDEVIDTLKSGWITTGPKTKLFEQKLANYCGAEKTLCLNSSTAGLEIALRWFGVKQGDEVIVPAYTYCATANVVLHCGATPVMVDVTADFNIDISQVEQKITSKTKAIIPVDFAGFPCDYDQLKNIVESKKHLFNAENKEQKTLGRILLVEDAAHALGASYNGKKIGGKDITDIAVFSFHAVKNLTTAEGGAMMLNLPKPFDNIEIYRALNIKTLHGQSKDALTKTKLGQWKYDVVEAGYKFNMTDIQASMGLVELKYYEVETITKRKTVYDQYNAFFSKYEWAILPSSVTNIKTTSYHLYPLRIKGISEQKRDKIIMYLAEQQIATNVHFQPLPLLSVYRQLGYDIKDYPNAYNQYVMEISLPVHYFLTYDMVGRVCEVLAKAVKEIC